MGRELGVKWEWLDLMPTRFRGTAKMFPNLLVFLYWGVAHAHVCVCVCVTPLRSFIYRMCFFLPWLFPAGFAPSQRPQQFCAHNLAFFLVKEATPDCMSSSPRTWGNVCRCAARRTGHQSVHRHMPVLSAPPPRTRPPAGSSGDGQGGHTTGHPSQTLWRMKGALLVITLAQ